MAKTTSEYYSGPPAFLISFLKTPESIRPPLGQRQVREALGELSLMEGHKAHAVVEIRYPGTKREHIIVAGCMELVA